MELLLRYYHPITIDDVLVYARSGDRLPEKSFFLSFDDGLRENYDIIAPILKGFRQLSLSPLPLSTTQICFTDIRQVFESIIS
jgi:hypothetical protein